MVGICLLELDVFMKKWTKKKGKKERYRVKPIVPYVYSALVICPFLVYLYNFPKFPYILKEV